MVGSDWRDSPGHQGVALGCCGFCRCIRNMKISRLLIFLVSGLLITFGILKIISYSSGSANAIGARHLDTQKVGTGEDPAVDLARKALGLIEWTHLSGPELHARLEELLRIKYSVQTELRNLEAKRSEMKLQVADFTRKIESLKVEATRHRSDLEKLKISIAQAKLVKQELAERNTPEILPPLKMTADTLPSAASPTSGDLSSCSMSSCFDWSRCPVSSGFPVYLYDHPDQWVASAILKSGYFTDNPKEACLYVAVINSDLPNSIPGNLNFWGNGRNHLLLDVGRGVNVVKTEAMLASRSAFDGKSPRKNFDLLLPAFESINSRLWEESSVLIPVRKKYLYSFQGSGKNGGEKLKIIQQTLEKVNFDRTDDRVSVNFTCPEERTFCGDEGSRNELIAQSTFVIIIQEANGSRSNFARRHNEALKNSAVPVIICIDTPCSARNLKDFLPFSEVVDHSKIAIFVPFQRLPELHFILRSIPDPDLFALKFQGRQTWLNYFGSGFNSVIAALNIVRSRLGLPAAAFKNSPSPRVFDESGPNLMEQLPPENEFDQGESLGPLEPPYPSPSFRRNFSSLAVDFHDQWNKHWGAAFYSAPQNPWDPILPTEAKFLGSGSGFRPINGGEGGSGIEFSQALGGNTPQEHFTVVMLTYQREQVLIDSLTRLYGLPYLNKVIVVWNNPEEMPAPDLRWPDIGVPIVVVKMEKNSLNNRFLPFDEIDTEAVLSVDDDAHLRHDEIIFGFRVWREHRDRLVGFPGRFHAWDKEGVSWNYNSNYSCELSMVLTGAAFYHKYYSYAYTHLMPEVIRQKVDEYMNCEDLAMNFLISHLTRQPPVKVTSRWTFRCPGCPVTLSEDDSHFQERHKCINFFSRVYGYMPLLYTQFRADSVLFKTRIPQDKQKCFKFI